MSIDIEKEKNQKKDNFIKNLEYFLEEVNDAINNQDKFDRHSRNSANLSRVIGESFCRFIILDSDKTDGEKEQKIRDTLSKLIETITRQRSSYIENERERNILKDRLNRILSIGNNDSHDTNYPTNKRDLDEVKSNILFLSDFLLGERLTKTIEEKFILQNNQEDNKNGINNIMNTKIKQGIGIIGDNSNIKQIYN